MKSLLITLLSLLALTVQAADFTAQVDRQRIGLDDTLTLILTLSARAQDAKPDLTPLQADFEILEQAQSQQVQVINGTMSAQTRWTLSLAPRHAGHLTIPALTLNGQHSDPIAVKVSEAATQAARQSGPVFLEAEVDQTRPYVQAQVLYTLRLYVAVSLREGNLPDPQPADTLVERLGDDIRYQSRVKGKRYQVIERRYALFPQKSGKLGIPAVTFIGRSAGRRSSRGGLGFPGIDDLLDRGQPIRARAPALQLTVRKPPAGADSPWLPAQSLTLGQVWEPDPPVFRVGEPVNRTLILRARGLSASQLPAPSGPDTPGLRRYLDKPERKTQGQGPYLLGQVRLREALIPQHPGAMTLPAIEIPWWNTQTEQREVARLSARTVQVLPAIQGQDRPAAPPLTTSPPIQPAAPMSPPESLSTALTPQAAGPWPWISAALLVGWLFTLALWWNSRRTPGKEKPSKDTQESQRRIRRRLQQACRDNDPRQARDALLAWAARRWPQRPPHTLDALLPHLGEPARSTATDLQRQLYRGDQGSWRGQELWDTVNREWKQAGPPDTHRPADDSTLPELYPHAD